MSYILKKKQVRPGFETMTLGYNGHCALPLCQVRSKRNCYGPLITRFVRKVVYGKNLVPHYKTLALARKKNEYLKGYKIRKERKF